MFKVNDYIYYGSGGICRIDAICTDPFEGARSGVLYYVLHTLGEPKQIIYNPVENDRVLMRYAMTRAEAEDFFALLPTLSPLEGESAKVLRERYLAAMKSAEPVSWGRVMRTYTTRRRLADAHLARVTDAERNFFESARRLLGNEIALALSISQADAEARLNAAVEG